MIEGKMQCGLQPWRGRSMIRQIAMLPLVFAGAMLFWTMALGLGAFSLIGLGAMAGDQFQVEQVQVQVSGGSGPTAIEPMPGQGQIHAPGEGISVHIQESAEPEDVNDNAGAVDPAATTPAD